MLKVVYKKTSELKPYAKNSRKHSAAQVDQICESVKNFGVVKPIIIDEKDFVLAGHGLLLAVKKIGIDSIPTITKTGLTDAQKRAYVIADNKIALNSEWDLGLLKEEMEALLGDKFDLSVLGFDEDELLAVLDQEQLSVIDEDEDDEDGEEEKEKIGFQIVLDFEKKQYDDFRSAMKSSGFTSPEEFVLSLF